MHAEPNEVDVLTRFTAYRVVYHRFEDGGPRWKPSGWVANSLIVVVHRENLQGILDAIQLTHPDTQVRIQSMESLGSALAIISDERNA